MAGDIAMIKKLLQTFGAATGLYVNFAKSTGVVFGPEELSVASGETSSHLTDPVQSWLLDSPVKEASGGVGGGQVATKELPMVEMEMEAGVEGEAVLEHPLQMQQLADLRSEATAVAPLAQGKRTKTVATTAPTKVIKKRTAASSVRKSSRHGGAAAATAMEKAKKLAAERNLDPATAVLEGSGQTEVQGLAGLGSGRRQEAVRADAV